MYKFFDTHIHLEYVLAHTATADKIILPALEAGVRQVLAVGITQESYAILQNLTALFQSYHDFHYNYGLGLHPLYIAQHQLSDLDQLVSILNEQATQPNSSCKAVAEIGLDRYKAELIDEGMWQKQCDFLSDQLAIAKQFNLPVSLHSRQSHDQLACILKQANLPRLGVIHGFSGSYQQAKRFVDLGYKLGVGGVITYPRANKTRRTIQQLPLEALVLETDSPDMPINGFQGMANRPDLIVHTFNALCELRSESADQIAEYLWLNSQQTFS